MNMMRPRFRVLAAVLLAHIGLAGLLMQLTRVAPGARMSAQPAAPAITWLQPLVNLPRRATTAENSSVPAPRRAAPQRRDARPLPAVVQPEAITLPTPAADPDTAVDRSAPAKASAVATAVEHPPLPPLDLRLPRSPTRAQTPAAMAHDDPRLPRRLSREERLARDLGADPGLIEQVTAGGHRYIKGGECVEVRGARAAQIDPFNANVRPTPKLVGRC